MRAQARALLCLCASAGLRECALSAQVCLCVRVRACVRVRGRARCVARHVRVRVRALCGTKRSDRSPIHRFACTANRRRWLVQDGAAPGPSADAAETYGALATKADAFEVPTDLALRD